MREPRQLLDLRRLVNRPHFGGLRNGDNPRLNVVLVAYIVIGMRGRGNGKLAIGRRKRDKLAAGQLFGRAAFVGINMRELGAKNGMVRACQRLQAEHVGGSTVEDEEHLDVGAEVLAKFLDGRSGIRVVTIADNVAAVGAGNGFKHLGMDVGIVVAGKTAARIHNKTI